MRLVSSLAVVMLLFGLSQAETVLDDISVSRQSDSIYVDIVTSKPTLYEHFMIQDAPEKIVVDLIDTRHIWPKRNFSDLPFLSINQIRTSQYKEPPELTTRVVLDINRPIEYRVEELPAGLRIVLPAVADEGTFAPWSAKESLLNATAVQNTQPVTIEEEAEPERVEQNVEPEAVEQKAEPEVAIEDNIEPEAVEQNAEPEVVTEDNAEPEKVEQKVEPESVIEEKIEPQKAESKPTIQTKVEDFPRRKVVDYKPGSDRDPFKPLVGQGTSVGAGMLPAVENLSLVGIFNDDTGVRALLEDAEGNGYILKPNDKVQNGYLVSIQKDKAVFQVTEYGWTRTVALNLQMPELK